LSRAAGCKNRLATATAGVSKCAAMKCCVIGLDPFGQHLARDLAELGAEVSVIGDRDETEVVFKIKDEVDDARNADLSDSTVLENAGVAGMDAVVVAVGDNFEQSLNLVIKAQELKARRVICRAISPAHERLLKLLRVDRVVVPEEIAARGLAHTLFMRGVSEGYEMGCGFSIIEALVPGLAGGCLRDRGEVFKKADVRIVTIKRLRSPLLEKIAEKILSAGGAAEALDDERVTLGVPSLDEVFRGDDVFVLFGRDKKLGAFVKEFGR